MYESNYREGYDRGNLKWKGKDVRREKKNNRRFWECKKKSISNGRKWRENYNSRGWMDCNGDRYGWYNRYGRIRIRKRLRNGDNNGNRKKRNNIERRK